MKKLAFLMIFLTSFIHAQELNTENREDTTHNILKISAGIGSAESSNLGMGYRYNRLQIMVSYGTKRYWDNLTTHISYYPYISSKYLVFIRVAITHTWDTYFLRNILTDSKQNLLTLYMGGDIRISDKFRFDLGFGFTTEILPYEPHDYGVLGTLPIVPAVSINIYYQFLL